jgi:ketosteroid isomerase-like protein
MSEENRRRVEAVYREWAEGNFRAGGELFAPDVSFEAMSDGRAAIGRKGIADYMREFLGQWSEFRIEAVKIEDRGEEIVVTERQRGTGAASGIDTEQTMYATWTFHGDQVTRARWSLEPPS